MLSTSLHVSLSGQHDVAFLKDIVDDAESKRKMNNDVIIASLKSEPTW